MILRKNADALALWLAKNQPEVFEGALRAAQGQSIPRTPSNLAGITDVLSSIGTSFGSAVKSVGSFLSSENGIKTLGAVGGLYLQSQAQRDALRLQVATVQAGYPPQPVQNVGYNTNTAVPMYGTQPLTPTLTNQLLPRTSILREYAPWAIGFAVALGFLYVSRPR
jgi:hypothetical protein